ncbi:amino acid ABC transporter substrate-binding protein [Brachyspira hampsonii]|uniref:Amino acid ABC transporter substrate-binding protein n=1 Tax=Brachyspira hampsonii TaxID=1287055 RepID=A0AAC9TWV3_9SPIR|nr:amino acid ABC transporter substrate-binding protein [Brachyspira hampsonii]ASJ22056.1 amino acid ABC transporter substrate-binding protein [Brachyspira hampsonii]ELV06497.1 extracellular solute-binding protein, family 3 [Brachyspira hampsonii 30599]MBW5381098.1 amino acid ABC transporter substrate-binding protein [Brachyspira hampsonii]OEJ16953.1 amino acid ABC transporter substrate-binding protein [Brachyspira hampsonii]
MKRISSILLFIIFAFIVSCGGGDKAASDNTAENTAASEDNSLQKVKDAGKLVLGLDDTFAPMGFRDENGEVVGFDIDLAKEVASRLGVELEIKPIEWSSSILSLNKGDVDVLWNGVTINEARKQQINFSKPYLNNRLVIVKAIDDNTINSKDDLSGKVLGVQVGSNDEALTADPASKYAKEIRRYDVNVNAFLDLQAKRIDAVVIDEVAAQYYISEKKAPFVVVDNSPLTEELYGVGFRKSDEKLLAEVDRILDEMRADGKATEISQKWFAKDIFLK